MARGNSGAVQCCVAGLSITLHVKVVGASRRVAIGLTASSARVSYASIKLCTVPYLPRPGQFAPISSMGARALCLLLDLDQVNIVLCVANFYCL
jgi:hypothetical protein